MKTLIGVTGRPGTRKHGAAKEIVKELRERDEKAELLSLSAPLLEEAKAIIPDLRGETASVDPSKIISHVSEKYGLTMPTVAMAQTHAVQDLGEWNPDYGYSRSNDDVRKILSLIAMDRRDRDEEYYLEMLVDKIERSGADWFVCADIRFPNEADYFADHGIVIRFELDQQMSEYFSSDNDGLKYNLYAQKNDPIESALDNYGNFYGTFVYASFDAQSFVDEVMAIRQEEQYV